MKKIILLISLLFSLPSFATISSYTESWHFYNTLAHAQSACNAQITVSGQSCDTLTDPTYGNIYRNTESDDPQSGHVVHIYWTCQNAINNNFDVSSCIQNIYVGSCENPEDDIDPITGECLSPTDNGCPDAGTTATLQFAPNGNVASVEGCIVTQTGNSTCTGTAEENGYCIADFQYTGDREPGTPMPGDENYVAPEDSPINFTGEPNPGLTGEGAGTPGQTTTTSETGTSTSTTTDNGDGTSTTTTTSSGSGTQDTQSNGTGSASNSCQLPPNCSGGDPQLCAILRQQWNDMCYGEQVDPNQFESDLQAGGLEELGEGDSVFGEENTIDPSSDIQTALNDIDTSFSTGACPFSDASVSFMGTNIDLEFSVACQYIEAIALVVKAFAGITCCMILLSGLSGGRSS